MYCLYYVGTMDAFSTIHANSNMGVYYIVSNITIYIVGRHV